VIARIWRARATPQRVSEYDAYFKATVVPELTAIPGYEGATLLHHAEDDRVEVTVITWWTSLEAVRAFAGEAVETAVVHDTAARMLLDFDREVVHHDVVFNEPSQYAHRRSERRPRQPSGARRRARRGRGRER
jgi:heme-degrading monooxygenase HmoA